MSQDEFQKDREGIFLPTPTGKEMRILMFEGNQTLQVSEEMEQIQELIDRAHLKGQTWVEFTSGAYDSTIVVPVKALDRLTWIDRAWVEMELAEAHMKQQKMAERLPKLARPGELGLELLADRQSRRHGRN
jgi:hypothetical protein